MKGQQCCISRGCSGLPDGVESHWLDCFEDYGTSSDAEKETMEQAGEQVRTVSGMEMLMITQILITMEVFSVYTRAEFTVADASEVVSMSLQVDYDDGFIAWLNGVLVEGSSLMSGVNRVWNGSNFKS